MLIVSQIMEERCLGPAFSVIITLPISILITLESEFLTCKYVHKPVANALMPLLSVF